MRRVGRVAGLEVCRALSLPVIGWIMNFQTHSPKIVCKMRIT